MPGNYTNYNPDQPISQEQIAALSEVKKILEARFIYNKNLLEFLLNKENEVESNTLIKNLTFFNSAISLTARLLTSLKEKFMDGVVNEIQYYDLYIQHIEKCETLGAFDDFYFQNFMQLESNKYTETEAPILQNETLMKNTNLSSDERKQSLEKSQEVYKEKDFSELKYCEEISSILEKYISLRACEFKQHHLFVASRSQKNESCIGIRWQNTLMKKLFSDIEILNKKLEASSNDTSTCIEFNKFCNMLSAAKQGNLEYYKQQLPQHSLDYFDSFNTYRVVREFFDLCMNLAFTSSRTLHPEKKPKPPKKTKKIGTTTSPTPELSIEPVIEQKECAAALTEVASPVAVHVTERHGLQERASNFALAFPMQEQKNDTSMLTIALSEVHPALECIAKLNPTEIAKLLSWTKKAPHMQVEIGELKRTIKNLNGKIDMSGGGSHHKIIFKNSLAFVDAFEQAPTTSAENTVKGTLVKQHGKKSSRFLPSYAIKTFIHTLQKMGITETILRVYTSANSSYTTFKNPQDRTRFLTNAQSALVREQSKMLLLLGVYKSKQNQKGDCSALKKLSPMRSSGKDATRKLMETIFSFVWPRKQ